MKKPAAKKPAPAPMKFEEAIVFLRRGKSIRRRSWHPESRLFRLDDSVFVKLPTFVSKAPSVWSPYPIDVLATDWAVCK